MQNEEVMKVLVCEIWGGITSLFFNVLFGFNNCLCLTMYLTKYASKKLDS